MINEFRASTDGTLFAFYDPGNGPWFAPRTPLEEWIPNPEVEGWSIPEPWMKGRFIESGAIDGFGFEWVRFLPADRAAREVLGHVAQWAREEGENDAVGRLLGLLGRKGFTLPEEDDDE